MLSEVRDYLMFKHKRQALLNQCNFRLQMFFFFLFLIEVLLTWGSEIKVWGLF